MRNRLRASWLGVLVAVTIAFAGCYPFQGDIALLLTPVPVDPDRQAEILAAMNQTQAEAAATPSPEGMAGEGEMTAVTATVSANSLRVRQGADPDSPIVAGLRQDDSVTVVGQSEDGAWLQVQVPEVDTLGWVSAESVTVDGDVTTLPVPDEAMAEQPEEAPAAEEAAAPAEGEMAMAGLTLNVDPASLQIVDGSLTVPSITSSSAGWLVVHADDGGTFGPVIGYAALAEGENSDVVVPIDTDAATETVHLMLHEDGGVVGTYEFPGADAPVIVDGAPVSMAYQVGAPVISEAAAAEGESEAAAAEGEGETAAAEGEDETAATEGEGEAAAEGEGETAAAEGEGEAAATEGEGEATAAEGEGEAAAAEGEGEATAAEGEGETAAAEGEGEAAAAEGEGEAAATEGEGETAAAEGEAAAAESESEAAAMSAGEAAAMAGMSSTELATVNTRSLRVRSAPAADAGIVGGALDGEVFPIAEKSADGKWVRIYFPGTEGDAWVGSEFVDVSAVGLNVKYGDVTVSTGGPRLRVRNAPALDGEIVGHVFDGDTRYAIGVSPDGGWALLFLPKITGPTWVSADYVTYQ